MLGAGLRPRPERNVGRGSPTPPGARPKVSSMRARRRDPTQEDPDFAAIGPIFPIRDEVELEQAQSKHDAAQFVGSGGGRGARTVAGTGQRAGKAPRATPEAPG